MVFYFNNKIESSFPYIEIKFQSEKGRVYTYRINNYHNNNSPPPFFERIEISPFYIKWRVSRNRNYKINRLIEEYWDSRKGYSWI